MENNFSWQAMKKSFEAHAAQKDIGQAAPQVCKDRIETAFKDWAVCYISCKGQNAGDTYSCNTPTWTAMLADPEISQCSYCNAHNPDTDDFLEYPNVRSTRAIFCAANSHETLRKWCILRGYLLLQSSV